MFVQRTLGTRAVGANELAELGATPYRLEPMSWFQNDDVLMDERPREAVAEGVLLERRSLLRVSAAAIAAGLSASCFAPSRERSATNAAPTPTQAAPLNDGSLDVAEFLAEMHPRARRFIASGGEREEAYLMSIGELMARIQTASPETTNATVREYLGEHPPTDGSMEIMVVMFRLEPGKGFTHHDHRDYNGVILGVEGEAHVTNYDILGDTPVPPKGETFQIRQTRDDLILPGRFSSLGRTRENVHELIAGPEGAVVLDVFTFLASGAGSHFMDVEPQPRDAERRIYDAASTNRVQSLRQG